MWAMRVVVDKDASGDVRGGYKGQCCLPKTDKLYHNF
jgi:hypothetical protein